MFSLYQKFLQNYPHSKIFLNCWMLHCFFIHFPPFAFILPHIFIWDSRVKREEGRSVCKFLGPQHPLVFLQHHCWTSIMPCKVQYMQHGKRTLQIMWQLIKNFKLSVYIVKCTGIQTKIWTAYKLDVLLPLPEVISNFKLPKNISFCKLTTKNRWNHVTIIHPLTTVC